MRIVDRAFDRCDTSRALVLWSRTLELLDALSTYFAGELPLVQQDVKLSAAELLGDRERSELQRQQFFIGFGFDH